jgi:hypothetical protein
LRTVGFTGVTTGNWWKDTGGRLEVERYKESGACASPSFYLRIERLRIASEGLAVDDETGFLGDLVI